MALKLIGRKKGMTRIFDSEGNLEVCSVISIEPHVVAQIKTDENDGYAALQLATEKLSPTKAKKQSKSLQGHFKKAGVDNRRLIKEARVDNIAEYQVGQELSVEAFSECKYVDVIGTSKGKGYQGTIKRWNFAGGPASHGSGFHRHSGSTGMRTSPGRNLPGGGKAGHMGNERVTSANLKVVKVDRERNLLLVRGAIPGARNGIVQVIKSVKKG
jgi:large subunit ribosomal protein L3